MKNEQVFIRKKKKKKKQRLKILKILVPVELLVGCVLLLLSVRWLKGGEKRAPETVDRQLEERLVSASMDHSAWILDGRLKLSGEPYEGQEAMESWSRLKQVAISDEHVVALDEDGRVYSAGQNANLQCEINGTEDVRYIDAGMKCSLCVMEDGTVRVFGVMEEGCREELEKEENVRAVAIGDHHVAVLHKDGTAAAYGENEMGQCELSGWKGVRQISAGYAFTVGLTEGGRLLYIGDEGSDPGTEGTWENLAMVDAGSGYVAAIDKDGNAYGAGANTQGQCNVNSWKGISAIAAGYDHTIGVDQQGERFAVGYNGSGQCDIF